MTWLWIILALLYVLSRIDLIPDVILGWGWIDDIIVLILLFRYLAKVRRMKSAWQQQQNSSQQQNQQNYGERPRTGLKDPYEILEVSANASDAEIRAAYRKLAAQYHPDKVEHLGQEFKDLAEQRFKEIQEAYQLLSNRK